MVLCFQHFQWMWLDELLWFPYIENTKAKIDKIRKRCYLCVLWLLLLLCFMLTRFSKTDFDSWNNSKHQTDSRCIFFSRICEARNLGREKWRWKGFRGNFNAGCSAAHFLHSRGKKIENASISQSSLVSSTQFHSSLITLKCKFGPELMISL